MKTLLLATCLLASSAFAQTVTNPSFETAPVPTGTWNIGPAAFHGWTLTGGTGGLWQPLGTLLPASDGPTVAWLNGGSLSQDLGVAPRLNTIYTLTISVGHRSDGYATTYQIALTDAGASFCATGGDSSTIPAGTWTTVTLTCPIGASQPIGNLGILISATGSQLDFDNVRLTSAPATLPVLQSVALSATLVWDDGTPITGSIQVNQMWGTVNTTLAVFSLDPSGGLSGPVVFDVGQTDPLIISFLLIDPTGKTVGTVQETVPKVMFANVTKAQASLTVNKTTLALKGFAWASQ